MSFDVERSQETWRKSWGDEPPVGGVGTEVLWERKGIRVWNLTLAPGETSPLHTHMNPYIFVVVESSPVRTQFEDGTERSDEDEAGAAVWVDLEDATRTHTLSNVGDRPYVNRVIEILG